MNTDEGEFRCFGSREEAVKNRLAQLAAECEKQTPHDIFEVGEEEDHK